MPKQEINKKGHYSPGITVFVSGGTTTWQYIIYFENYMELELYG